MCVWFPDLACIESPYLLPGNFTPIAHSIKHFVGITCNELASMSSAPVLAVAAGPLVLAEGEGGGVLVRCRWMMEEERGALEKVLAVVVPIPVADG